MLQRLKTATPLKWNVYLPVENLVVASELLIGPTSIRMFEEATKQSILQTFVAINRLCRSPADVGSKMEQLFEDRLTTDYAGRAVIRISTTAADPIRAVESAIEQAETALNVLQFYSRGVIAHDARAYKMYIGLKGSIHSGQLFAIAFSGSEKSTTSFQNIGYRHKLKLEQKELSNMEKDSFKVLHDILSREPKRRSVLENLIVNSVNLFGSAMNNQDTASAFVSIVVVLESILLRKGEPIRSLLAERVAFLLGSPEDVDERMFYFKQMSRLCQIRSDIVHSGLMDVTESDLQLLSIMAYQVLVRLIADSSNLKDMDQLVQAFNALKFGRATFPYEK